MLQISNTLNTLPIIDGIQKKKQRGTGASCHTCHFNSLLTIIIWPKQ